MANFVNDIDVSRIRGNRVRCRVLKRCIFGVIAIGVLPIILIYTLVGDEFYAYKIKHNHHTNFENHSQLTAVEGIVPSQDLSKTETDIINDRMQNRLKRLTQKCSEYGLDVPQNDSWHKANPWEFLVNKKHHIIWCNVFKAASTSWMYNFNLLAGYTEKFLRRTNIVPLELARKRYGRVSIQELDKAMNNSITFLIVRHPFERLLSAYRDKIMFALPHTLHDKLGIRIVRKYRKYKHSKLPKWPLFSEFVDYLLDEMNKTNPKVDMHWIPITQFCTPCQIKFDIIAKFETLNQDQRYIIEKAKLKHYIKPQWRNSGKGRNTQTLIAKFFSQLTKAQLIGLTEIYRYDLDLFDYSPARFHKYLRNSVEI